MNFLQEILEFNKKFVEKKEYLPYQTTRFPDKKMVILSCMDTRLVELLPKAMNLRNGDAKIIKNAGAVITQPFGSVMRSILVAIYKLKAQEVYVIGHHGCGMIQTQPKEIIDTMVDNGIERQTISTLRHAGINVESWLEGFNSVEESVQQTVQTVKGHPLFPSAIPVYGLIIDPENGKLETVGEVI